MIVLCAGFAVFVGFIVTLEQATGRRLGEWIDRLLGHEEEPEYEPAPVPPPSFRVHAWTPDDDEYAGEYCEAHDLELRAMLPCAANPKLRYSNGTVEQRLIEQRKRDRGVR